MFEIHPANPEDSAAIEKLLDVVFGPGRFSKTSYRLREGVDPVPGLSLVAYADGQLVATIRYWPVVIGEKNVPALLMGPVGVASDRRGEGIGVALIRRTLEMAAGAGHRIVVLVGDAAYYQRFGFVSAYDHGIDMPGQNGRLMVKELAEGALSGVHGDIARWRGVQPGLMAA